MSKAISLALRGLQFLWTLLILALVGNMIATSSAGDPSVVNYSMFVAVFGMLSLIYLIAGTINEAYSIVPMFMLIVDALNTVFFFCGGVALAADLDVHSCNNEEYLNSNGITNGADDKEKRCREAQAVCAFLWFGFAAFAASIFFSFLAMRSGTTPRPSIVRSRGGPSMSQV